MSETFEPGETARNFGYALLIWISAAAKLACAVAGEKEKSEKKTEKLV